ncbi:MAG TPA: hypothetical protein VN805_05015 [Caulobacteraceae bacterium]|nr:hypothetical protein [Caulobacteraceae bacterium]
MNAGEMANIDAAIGHTKAAITAAHAFFRGARADAEVLPGDMDNAALAQLFVAEDRGLFDQAETILARSRTRLRTLRRIRATGLLMIYDLILLGDGET